MNIISGHLVPSPFWDLLMLQLLRPNSSNLPCLYSTFHLEYPFSPAGTLNKCSNFEESMKLCRNVEYDHLNYFSYSAIRNLIRHAIYFKLKNVISKTLIRMTL